ncbi:MAG TPA: helix-turn-helix domain-containing protein [Jatrophihabitantaceae bacterium]
MLEGVGLSPHQEELYLGLLAHPGQSLDDIAARHLDRPRPQLVAVVESLVDLGLATRLAGSPPLYTAIAPDVAVEGLARVRIDDARRVTQAIPALMDRFWTSLGDTGSVDFIEIVTSESTILQRWGQLGRAVSKELRAFDRPPYFSDPLEPDSVELQRLADGITYRVIYAQSVVDVPGRWADLEAGIAAGEQARVLPELPAKLTLFDDFAATLSMQAGPAGAVSVLVVHRSPLLDSLSALFEAYWQRAIPLGVDEASGSQPHDDQLVRLLAAGLGDSAIQRALGVSASTVHRRVHALMSGLGARTRFQAGFQLARMRRPR